MEAKTKHKSRLIKRRASNFVTFCAKDERNAAFKKIATILKKNETDRTSEEIDTLFSYTDIVNEVKSRLQKRSRDKLRLQEIEEPLEVLEKKCEILANVMAKSKHLVIYTGAGISTAARIPDYRGTNGIWTRLQQGKEIGKHDLSLAEPTYTHMALSKLYHQGIVKYVVSQNCDGLHLRSGLPKTALSELHGNMLIEVCKHCKPSQEYLRNFDVTENTARYSHKTSRRCYSCNNALVDTIVHFGERGTLQWPLNWSGACKSAEKADVIICIGSSLKVLKKYPWLWQMNRPVKKRSELYIINLQWTPKDDVATLKIHGKCDTIMKLIMDHLNIKVPEYQRESDPLFYHASLLADVESHTKTQPDLMGPENTSSEIENKCETTDIKSEKIEIETKIKLEENLEIRHSPIKNSIFSMDNILDTNNSSLATTDNKFNLDIINAAEVTSQNDVGYLYQSNTVKHENIITPNLFSALNYNINLQTMVAYYEAIAAARSFTEVTSPILYPYQTGFLYPGLHSIINPLPFIKYDFSSNHFSGINHPVNLGEKDCSPTNTITTNQNSTPSCSFCHKQYKSFKCLFYTKHKPDFEKVVYRFSKTSNSREAVYCECCDYSSDSESEGNKSDNQTKQQRAKPEKTEVVLNSELANDDKNDESTDYAKAPTVQPGWFGKGYRKNRRVKKR